MYEVSVCHRAARCSRSQENAVGIPDVRPGGKSENGCLQAYRAI